METEGLLAPDSAAEAGEQYAAVAPAADAAAREVAKALDLGADDFREQVDEDVVLTAHEAIFASLLVVHVGTHTAFEDWLADRPGDPTVTTLGSDAVSGVVWHDAPVADQVLAATYADEPAAAAHTLRRQAFARIYREVV